MKYSALVPVKSLGFAKSRLAAHFSQHQREMLVLDMLRHVIQTLGDSDMFEQVYVVSADARVLELALQWGAEALRETQTGHNPALQAAALTIMARAAWRAGLYSTWLALTQSSASQTLPEQQVLQALHQEALLTISADLPLLTQEDIVQLAYQAESAQIVLAASSDGTGTNALLARPPLVLPYLFGQNSLPAYVRAAREHQLSYAVYRNARLGFDVDTPDDVRQLELTEPSRFALAGSAI